MNDPINEQAACVARVRDAERRTEPGESYDSFDKAAAAVAHEMGIGADGIDRGEEENERRRVAPAPTPTEMQIIDPPGLKGGPGAQMKLVREYLGPFGVRGDDPPIVVAANGEAMLSMMWPVHDQTQAGEKAAVEHTVGMANKIAELLNHAATLEQELAEWKRSAGYWEAAHARMYKENARLGAVESPTPTAEELAWKVAYAIADIHKHSRPCTIAGELPKSVEIILATLTHHADVIRRQCAEEIYKRTGEAKGFAHSSECWEMMHAKAHEEVERLTKERDEARRDADSMRPFDETQVDKIIAERDTIRQQHAEEVAQLRTALAAEAHDREALSEQWTRDSEALHRERNQLRKTAEASAYKKANYYDDYMRVVAERDAQRNPDGGLVDLFLADLLAKATARGVDMSDCDGDDDPATILAGWIAGRVQSMQDEMDRADKADADRATALAAQAALMQQLAAIHDLAISQALTAKEIVSAIADRTKPHHTPV